MVSEALEVLSITDGILTILLVSEKKIQQLNREFFHKDRPTNVLSFSYTEEKGTLSPSQEEERFEGDVIVSLNTVLSEVKGGYLTDEEKIFFYILHGIMHIQGYDHTDDMKDAPKMRGMETAIFEKVTGKKVD